MLSWMPFIVLLATAITALVAVADLWYAPRRHANQSFALGMLATAVMLLVNFFVITADQQSAQLNWARIAFLIEGLGPACWLYFSLSYAREGASRFSRTARLAVVLAASVPLIIALFTWNTLLVPPLVGKEPGRYLLLGSWGYLFTALILLGFVWPLVNLELTLRASTGLGRWHIKFMILGVGLLLGFEIYVLSYRLLNSFVDLWMIGPQAVVAILASGLVVVSLLRTRQKIVELSISHLVLFRSVSLLIIGGYLIAIGGLAHFWVLIGGSTADMWQGTLILVALVVLAGLMFSSQFNAHIKQAISRHIYPHRYDYRQEWLQLTDRMSRHLDLESSLNVVVERLSEAFSAPRVSAWLFDETGQRLHLAATVQLSSDEETAWRTQPINAPALTAVTSSWNGPMLADPLPRGLDNQIRSDLQEVVLRTKARLVAPLVIGGRVLGLLAVGPSVAGVRYGREELLFAGAIAQQSAAYVMTTHLTRELMHTREIELSQLFSTFLIHDLKNLGTTLSLVAQNLPLRYADLHFRDDAIRIIYETTEKIRSMTHTVTTLGQHYELVLEPTDMNRIVEESLKTLNGSVPSAIFSEQEPLPLIMVDRRQIRSVLTNLILNAQEATGDAGGAIQLRTQHRNGCAVLSVTDQGIGMTKEFVSEHLFQPFHSTKPNGLGIGLFQCRKIVEAHGGRIDVKSQVGKGTTVILSLPSRVG